MDMILLELECGRSVMIRRDQIQSIVLENDGVTVYTAQQVFMTTRDTWHRIVEEFAPLRMSGLTE